MPESAIPAYITSLIRHFEDLRDGTHGGSVSRKDKEAHFEKEVQLLAPIARQVLTEMNTSLLLDTGQLTETGLGHTADGGLNASWALSWPEQRAAGVEPIVLQAYFGAGFHHPHLRGTTVHDWPLNVFSEEDAAAFDKRFSFSLHVSCDLAKITGHPCGPHCLLQMAKTCVLTRPDCHELQSSLSGSRCRYRLGQSMLHRKWQRRTARMSEFVH